MGAPSSLVLSEGMDFNAAFYWRLEFFLILLRIIFFLRRSRINLERQPEAAPNLSLN